MNVEVETIEVLRNLMLFTMRCKQVCQLTKRKINQHKENKINCPSISKDNLYRDAKISRCKTCPHFRGTHKYNGQLLFYGRKYSEDLSDVQNTSSKQS